MGGKHGVTNSSCTVGTIELILVWGTIGEEGGSKVVHEIAS
jgi:hypothetical protein